MKLKIFLLTAIMLFFSVHISAQRKKLSREQLDSIMNPPLLSDSRDILKFSNSSINIGEITEDDNPRSYVFTFINYSDSEIIISKINTGCGCTSSKFDSNPVLPGKEGSFTLSYNPHNRVGKVNQKVFIYTNLSDKQPTASVSLTGEVRAGSNQWKDFPVAMGDLRLRRKNIIFRKSTESDKSTERIAVVNSGEKDIKLSVQLLPDYLTFATEPEIIKAGEEADLAVTLDFTKMPSSSQNELKTMILIDGINGSSNDRIINITVVLKN